MDFQVYNLGLDSDSRVLKNIASSTVSRDMCSFGGPLAPRQDKVVAKSFKGRVRDFTTF